MTDHDDELVERCAKAACGPTVAWKCATEEIRDGYRKIARALLAEADAPCQPAEPSGTKLTFDQSMERIEDRYGDAIERLDVRAEDDFYEDDEPIEKIKAAFERGKKVVTAPPADREPLCSACGKPIPVTDTAIITGPDAPRHGNCDNYADRPPPESDPAPKED